MQFSFIRFGINIPGTRRQKEMAGRSIIQFQLRKFYANNMAMARNASNENTRISSSQTNRERRKPLNHRAIYSLAKFPKLAKKSIENFSQYSQLLSDFSRFSHKFFSCPSYIKRMNSVWPYFSKHEQICIDVFQIELMRFEKQSYY